MDKRIYDVIKHYLEGRCIDFGCGNMKFTKILKDMDINISGIDKRDQKSPYNDIEYHFDDLTSLEFDDSTFDNGIAVNVLHHLSIKNRNKFLEQVYKVLSANGTLILMEHVKTEWTQKQKNFIDYHTLVIEKDQFLKNEHFPVLSETSIMNLISKSNFEIIETALISKPDLVDQNQLKDVIFKRLKNDFKEYDKFSQRALNISEKIEAEGLEEVPMAVYVLKSKKIGVIDSYKIIEIETKYHPREQLLNGDIDNLKNSDLLAVIIGMGNKNEDIKTLSQRLLREYGSIAIAEEKSPKKLMDVLGIGEANACKIVATFELGRRFYQTDYGNKTIIRGPEDVYNYLADMKSLLKEHFRGLYLNSKNVIIHDEVISIGHLTASLVHPREVFKPAMLHSAAAIIVAHNHPSGFCEPSPQDNEITETLKKAGKTLGIPVLDHIIVGKENFYSYNLKSLI
ncbi:MAG: DNA repair protein RadC [Candidatus Delongbacteria bacterium]|nr:DNA repair protein RadC [Candidatus Delongbacteria bacterium]MBN2836977.1 DNA repair protein RadC [Candidatus Delongbacteria bacterium]